jgi:hypothetical protein
VADAERRLRRAHQGMRRAAAPSCSRTRLRATTTHGRGQGRVSLGNAYYYFESDLLLQAFYRGIAHVAASTGCCSRNARWSAVCAASCSRS